MRERSFFQEKDRSREQINRGHLRHRFRDVPGFSGVEIRPGHFRLSLSGRPGRADVLLDFWPATGNALHLASGSHLFGASVNKVLRWMKNRARWEAQQRAQQ